VQEFGGRVWPQFGNAGWLPGSIISTTVVVVAWAYFIWTGSISTIWPMFGIANQLLAAVALAVGTTVIINAGRARYAWITLIPLSFVAINTLVAGFMSVRDNFWPMATGSNPSLVSQGYVNSICIVIMMVCVVIILTAALHRWLRGAPPLIEGVIAPRPDPQGL